MILRSCADLSHLFTPLIKNTFAHLRSRLFSSAYFWFHFYFLQEVRIIHQRRDLNLFLASDIVIKLAFLLDLFHHLFFLLVLHLGQVSIELPLVLM